MTVLWGTNNCCCNCYCSNCADNKAPCCWKMRFSDDSPKQYILTQSNASSCTWEGLKDAYSGTNTSPDVSQKLFIEIFSDYIEVRVEYDSCTFTYKKEFISKPSCCIGYNQEYELEFDSSSCDETLTNSVFISPYCKCNERLCMVAVPNGIDGGTDCSCSSCSSLNTTYRMPKIDGNESYYFRNGIDPVICDASYVVGGLDNINGNNAELYFSILKYEPGNEYNGNIGTLTLLLRWSTTITKGDDDTWSKYLLDNTFILYYEFEIPQIGCGYCTNNQSTVTVNFDEYDDSCEEVNRGEEGQIAFNPCACASGKNIAIDIQYTDLNGDSVMDTFISDGLSSQSIPIYHNTITITYKSGGTETIVIPADCSQWHPYFPLYFPVLPYSEFGSVARCEHQRCINIAGCHEGVIGCATTGGCKCIAYGVDAKLVTTYVYSPYGINQFYPGWYSYYGTIEEEPGYTSGSINIWCPKCYVCMVTNFGGMGMGGSQYAYLIDDINNTCDGMVTSGTNWELVD